MANRVLVNEDSLKDIAAAIKEKTGDFETSYTPGEMGPAIRNIEAGGAEPNLGELIATDNGEYIAESDGYDGYSHVYVQVEGESAELGETSISANGEYYATDEGYDGYHTIYVDVSPNLTDITITENGTYEPLYDEGYDGYATITVDVPSSGGGDLPEEAFNITGDCSYRFAYGSWDWFINNYGNKITTKDIMSAVNMFESSKINRIPFEINFKDGGGPVSSMFAGAPNLSAVPSIDFKHTSTYQEAKEMFYGSQVIKEIGTLKNLYPSAMGNMFNGCMHLRYLPEFENLNLTRMQTYKSANMGNMFSYCYSLRSIPEDFLKQLYGIQTSSSYLIFNGFSNCYALDEVRGVNPQTGALTSNCFNYAFNYLHRAKDIAFAVQDDGTPYSVNWKSQTIDLTKYVGYANMSSDITYYNSGITADKQVVDDATYQALKDDPDWFTVDINYSRYNHNSAVNTINSLPDVSASGGTNTIKFKGESGSLTDGGAINTLTEEEIAVAAAKGWTVSLA